MKHQPTTSSPASTPTANTPRICKQRHLYTTAVSLTVNMKPPSLSPSSTTAHSRHRIGRTQCTLAWTLLLCVSAILLLCTSPSTVHAKYTVEQTTMLDTPFVRTIFHAFRDFTFRWVRWTSNKTPSPKYLAAMPTDFPCDVRLGRSAESPTSVHRLRPGDIKVIAALGDSLTAGSGAASTRPQDLLMENRGLAWSIGGQWTWRNATTLPNILKQFQPALVGYSLNDAYPFHADSQLNMAEIGAVSADLPYMTRALVQRIRADRRVDFKRDWKLVTLCMGGNDICSFVCTMDEPQRLPEQHRERLVRSLRYLRDHMPRTYVNVVPVPLVATVVERTDKPTRCEILHHGECSCWVGRLHKRMTGDTQRMHEIQKRMQEVEVEVAGMKEFQQLGGFAVVHQPFSSGLSLKTAKTDYDLSLLAYDCFHMSQKGHAWAGVSLWNNMLERPGAKSTNWASPEERFLCPSATAPFLYTYDNARENLQAVLASQSSSVNSVS